MPNAKRTPTRLLTLFTIALAGFLTTGLTGCEEKSPAERAAENVSDTMESAGEELEDATEKAQDKADDAKDAAEDAADDVDDEF